MSPRAVDKRARPGNEGHAAPIAPPVNLTEAPGYPAQPEAPIDDAPAPAEAVAPS
jgi:hypothetical protein